MPSLRIAFHIAFRTAGPHDLDWVLDTDPIGRTDKRRNGFLQRGVGSALVRHVARELASGDRFFTSTNASNEAAQRLFARLGFRRCGTIEEIDPGDPEWIYVLDRLPS